jgi:hypothetical protein
MVVDVFAPEPADPVAATAQPVEAPVHQSPVVVAPQAPTRPVPEHQLTADQRRVRELENQLAVERGRKDPEPEMEFAPAGGSNIVIHFVGDGISALGKVWTRGQELEFAPDSPAFRDTCDRNGRSWLSLVDDPVGQEARWREVKFRRGPWPGKPFAAAATEVFDGPKPTADELRRADEAEARRNRAAPRLPVN